MASTLHLRFAKRKRRAHELTPAERRALAPQPPRGAQVRYLALVDMLDRRMRAAVERHLFPLLELDGLWTGNADRQGAANPAQLLGGVFRQDAFPCGLALPAWYSERAPRLRQDAWVPRGDDRYADAFDALQDELDQITEGFQVPLSAVARDVVRSNVDQSASVLGGPKIGAQGYETRVADFVRRNVGLVKSVQAQQLERLQEIVQGAHGPGTRVEGVQAELMATFNLPRARASLIARDQVLKLNSQITQERQKAAGIDTYIWTTTKDERVRGRPGGVWAKSQADHWALDGTRQRWAVAPITNPVTGARNHPGEDFQCRCVALPDVERVLGGDVRPTGPAPEQPPPVVLPEPLPPPLPRAKAARPKHYEVDQEAVKKQIERRPNRVFQIVPIAEINVQAVWQSAKLDPLRKRIAGAAPIDPVLLGMGFNGKYEIEDGIHRVQASIEAGYTHVPALVDT